MVRLKDWLFHFLLFYVKTFQFHYGSVKSGIVLCLLIFQLAFQFHYGSVKR